jgi:alpha-tubulin suppressor-like RCC1 family protein
MSAQHTRSLGRLVGVVIAALSLGCAILLSFSSMPTRAAERAFPDRAGILPAAATDAGLAARLHTSGILTGSSAFLPVVMAPRWRGEFVTAADGHACVITSDPDVKCWGTNGYGQLGTGQTSTFVDVPVAVVGLDEPVRHISAGGVRWSNRFGMIFVPGRTCVVTFSGALKCWGDAFEPKGKVVTVLPVGVADIATGAVHACALMEDKTVQCWGANASGEVGDGTLDPRNAPVPVEGLSGPAAGVTAGVVQCFGCIPYMTGTYGHSCALIQNGDVQCWGDNRAGQLGDGRSGEGEHSTRPVNVSGLSGQALQIHTTGTSTCALTKNGAVRCWGGVFGVTPRTIQGIATPMEELFDLCGKDAAGSLYCWQNHPEPAAAAVDVPVRVTSYALGRNTECLTAADGSVWCNGYNGEGELGNGQGGLVRAQPVDVFGLSRGVNAITGGDDFACVGMLDGSVRCWGSNTYGQLGSGTLTGVTVPTATVGLSYVVQISAGNAHVCARVSGGSVACWGANDKYQIGDSALLSSSVPITVLGLAEVSDIAAGGRHTCAVLSGGILQCWGDDTFGQLARQEGVAQPLPQTVAGLAGRVQTVGAGSEHTCALLESGAVQCWGGNQYGQLGIGTTSISETVPVTVTGLASGVTGLAAGAYHTCALMASDRVRCWGIGKAGSYVASTAVPIQALPLEVAGLEHVEEIAAGGTVYSHYPTPTVPMPPPLTTVVDARTCAITDAEVVKCWQMGQETPPAVPDGLALGSESAAVGAEFACAVAVGGAARCWGRNDSGQLGNASPWSPFWMRAAGF